MQGFCTRLKLTPEIRVQQIYPIRFYNELLLFSSKMCHMSIRYAQQLQPTKLTRNLLRNCEKEHYNSPFPRHLIIFNIFAIVHCLNCKTYFIQYEVFVLCFRFCVRKYVVKCETWLFFFACRLSPPHISYMFYSTNSSNNHLHILAISISVSNDHKSGSICLLTSEHLHVHYCVIRYCNSLHLSTMWCPNYESSINTFAGLNHYDSKAGKLCAEIYIDMQRWPRKIWHIEQPCPRRVIETAHVSHGTGTRIEKALISRAARCGLFFNLEINHWILLI